MPYGETKVYFDGSHYIAIPHTERPTRRRSKPIEEIITVTETPPETIQQSKDESAVTDDVIAPIPLVEEHNEQVTEQADSTPQTVNDSPKNERKTTRKELFNELYQDSLSVKKSERRKRIIAAMLPYFKNETETAYYVDENIQRKQRNLICQRIRLSRKINLQDFNYFVTFTYNDALHTEDSFKKGLKKTLANFASRRSWKYVGVWERSPKKQRLHFHGLFNIPNGSMPPLMIEVNDYNFNTHRRQITHQNTYFNDRFGRSDFETIKDKSTLGSAVAYIMKYLEKTGEKIVYSKGLPQYFISDIMDEDILCPFGLEDKKLLLYDDFRCWDEGVLMGNVSKSVIAQMRKSN
jgi:hypothetical protein